MIVTKTNAMARIAELVSRDPEEEIVRLKRALRECEKVRDAWCAEYVKVRDEPFRLTSASKSLAQVRKR